MKRSILCLVLALALLLPVGTVFADLIIEPNNDFYYRNSQNCTHIGRSFILGDDLPLLESPGSKQSNLELSAGSTVYIQFTYQKGSQVWGVCEILPENANEWVSGWLPMDQLTVVYDGTSFYEDHRDAYYQYTGSYEHLFTTGTQRIIYWEYPGSGKKVGSSVLEPDENYSFDYAYRDSEGQEWGYISYYMGHKDCWVCISDPFNEDLASNLDNPPTGVWVAPESPSGGISATAIAVILVACLAVVTAILIRILYKPSKQK